MISFRNIKEIKEIYYSPYITGNSDIKNNIKSIRNLNGTIIWKKEQQQSTYKTYHDLTLEIEGTGESLWIKLSGYDITVTDVYGNSLDEYFEYDYGGLSKTDNYTKIFPDAADNDVNTIIFHGVEELWEDYGGVHGSFSNGYGSWGNNNDSPILCAIIPNVPRITLYAFSGCLKLESVILSYGIQEIDFGAFLMCSNLSTIVIPDSVTRLGSSCFQGCSSLTSLNLPDSITTIESSCFESCNFETITLPNNLTTLPQQCFYSCTNLETIVIPNSVTSLGEKCFSNCYSLENIILSNNLISIGKQCFHYCESLQYITIPKSVTRISEEDWLYNCNSIELITLEWENLNEIISFSENWNSYWGFDWSYVTFSIPPGTSSLYVSKNYPSNQLVERNN